MWILKRVFAISLLFVFLLTGCGALSEVDNSSNTETLGERDSTVKLDIYPNSDLFDSVGKFDRVQYNTLSKSQQTIYIIMDNAIYDMSTGYVKLGKCSTEDIETAYHALRCDRPEYFWLPLTYTLRTSDTGSEIRFAKKSDEWLYSKSEREELEKKIRNDLEAFLDTVDGSMTDYELELKAHDFLANRAEYDHSALQDPDARPHAWSVIGVFEYGKAVCEGYSRAFQLMCFMLGLDCTVVTGETTEPHMWNLVKIDGDWYHVDLTSNDTDSTPYHFFFNVTTDYMLKGRSIDPVASVIFDSDSRCNLFLPRSDETTYNYHIVNSSYIASMSQVESTVVSHICNAVRSGKRRVEFAVSEELGFVFGDTDASQKFDLERCVSAANAELSATQRIRSYSYGGVKGALGFIISW